MGRHWLTGALALTFACIVLATLLLDSQPALHSASSTAAGALSWLSGRVWGVTGGEEEEGGHRQKRQGSGDECPNDVYEACGSTLPVMPDGESIDFRYMPTLANGHLGFQPFGDTVFMNGLYNGNDESSHRARIPAMIMSKIYMGSEEEERMTIRKYSFNAKEGTFTEEIECSFAHITHRVYAHQKYNKVIVSDIYAERKSEIQGGGVVHMRFPPENSSDDITFQPKDNYHGDWQMQGVTKEAETGSATKSLYMFWMQPIRDIPIREQHVRKTMVMAADVSGAAASTEFDRVLYILYDDPNGGGAQLLQDHIVKYGNSDAWEQTWERGGVEVESDNKLIPKLTAFAQYNVISNLPAQFPYQNPQKSEHIFGVGRGSLGRGAYNLDHQGHVMWDSELYVLPAVLPFHPDLAKDMLRYRSALSFAAQQHAENNGDKGYRFPWESGFSGGETTPSSKCPGCRERQVHTSAGVAWAIRQYYSLTRDRDFHTNPDYNGCDMTRELARFYANRAVYNTSEGRYDIADVMGPNDFHDHVMNNAYTQVAASLAIHWARYMACMCGRNERDEVPDEWLQKALYMKLPYDNVKRTHYAHEGYEFDPNVTIKQADTILLAYPLNWNMSRDIMKNDLEFYENRLFESSPAMTYSFMTVGWKFVEDYSKMTSYFIKSYEDYLVQPYKVWLEYPYGHSQSSEDSTVNFLPGMGAFLQSLIYGFAGVRIRPEHLEFHNPMPPPGSNLIRLRGFYYLGGDFTFTIHSSGRVEIEVLAMEGEYAELVLLRNSSSSATEESLNVGETITLEDGSSGFFIYSLAGTPCEHPRDYIYMPWGYSPWVSAATVPAPGLALTLAALLYTLTTTS